jgi:ParB-like chromosome segregation protein Spo0J
VTRRLLRKFQKGSLFSGTVLNDIKLSLAGEFVMLESTFNTESNQGQSRPAPPQLHGHSGQVKTIPVSDLTRFAGNARTHSRKQIRQIAASIKRFGFTVPILVDDEGQIIAGHGRVEAAKLLGWSEVPSLRLSHLSPAEKRAYVIADNRLAELAGWDRDALVIELQGLIELDFAVEVTGFEMSEIELILHDKDEGQNESAEVEAKSRKANSGPVVSRHGDVWLLGAHRLACGEAREANAYAAVDAAVRRWQAFTGQSATLADFGQTFKEIEHQRRKASGRRASGQAAVAPSPEAA